MNLEINQRFSDIAIPGQEGNFFSYAKKIFGEIIKFEPYILEEFEKIKKSFLLEEENFDLLYTTENVNDLKLLGYKETTINSFHCEQYNCGYLKEIAEIKKSKLLLKEIEYADTQLFFEKENNHILIFKGSKQFKLVDIKCINGTLLDFGLDNKGNVFVLYKNNDKLGFIKTNKGLNFFLEFNDEHSIFDLNSNESFYNIKNIEKPNIDFSKTQIISDEKENIFLLNGNKKFKLILTKKYYCYKDGLYYYNDIIQENGITKNGQEIDHLFLNELLSLYGLTELKTKDTDGENNIKINSLMNEKIKKLLSFKFDNTLNGTINFFDFFKKQRHIKINNGKVLCKGNFVYEKSEKGFYKIKIKILSDCESLYDKVNFSLQLLYSKDNTEYKVVEEGSFYTVSSFDGYERNFYFKNLQLHFFNFEYDVNNEFEFMFFNENLNDIIFEKVKITADNKIIYKIKDLNYKLHNPKGFNESETNIKGNFNFKFEDGFLIFENIYIDEKSLFKTKLNKNNFQISFLNNGKPNEFFKSLNKKSYYVNVEDIVEFDSSNIVEQIKLDKEVIINIE